MSPGGVLSEAKHDIVSYCRPQSLSLQSDKLTPPIVFMFRLCKRICNYITEVIAFMILILVFIFVLLLQDLSRLMI